MAGGDGWDPGSAFTIWVWAAAAVGALAVLVRVGLRFWQLRWLFIDDYVQVVCGLVGLAVAAVWQVFGEDLVAASPSNLQPAPPPKAAVVVAYLTTAAIWLLKLSIMYAAWRVCAFKNAARVAWWGTLFISIAVFATACGTVSSICPYASNRAILASCVSGESWSLSNGLLIFHSAADTANNLLVLFFPIVVHVTSDCGMVQRMALPAAALVLQALDSTASFSRLLNPMNAPSVFALASISLAANLLLTAAVTWPSDDGELDDATMYEDEDEDDSLPSRLGGYTFPRTAPGFGAPTFPSKRVVTVTAIKDAHEGGSSFAGPSNYRGAFRHSRSSRGSRSSAGAPRRPHHGRTSTIDSAAFSDGEGILPLQGTRPPSEISEEPSGEFWAAEPMPPPPPPVAQINRRTGADRPHSPPDCNMTPSAGLSNRSAPGTRPGTAELLLGRGASARSTPDYQRRTPDRRPGTADIPMAGMHALTTDGDERVEVRPHTGVEARPHVGVEARPHTGVEGTTAAALRSWHDGPTATRIWDEYRRAAAKRQ